MMWPLRTHRTRAEIYRQRRNRVRPTVTQLEARWLLSIYTINSAGDAPLDPSMPPGETSDGSITLRSAIQQVDLDGYGDILTDFVAPTTITLQSPLPTIDVPATIDGFGPSNYPYTIISGQDLPSGSGPVLSVANTTGYFAEVLNLVVENGSGDGIDVSGSDVLIDGDYVGTDPWGPSVAANAGAGVSITGSDNYVAACVISGNEGDGIDISGSSATGNVVEVSWIGVNQAGTAAVANSGSGIVISGGASDNDIGSSPIYAGDSLENVISGNDGNGVWIKDAGTSGNLVAGNFIGTGQYGIDNGSNGVEVSGGASNNTIGGTALDYDGGNVISGNAGYGLEIDAPDCLASANLIGTDVDSSTAVGNDAGGIHVGASGSSATIGGTSAAAGNTVSGNQGAGIFIQAPCLVIGNLIGADDYEAAHFFDLGNTGDGIDVDAPNVTIGKPGAGNIISGNGAVGVKIEGPDCLVVGNIIGTNSNVTSAVGNGASGIFVAPSGADAQIGGTLPGARNIVSGNNGTGIYIEASCLVVGNIIGTNEAGDSNLGNTGDGIDVVASGVAIGGSTSFEGNVVSGNGGDGISLHGAGTTGDVVAGNFIGTPDGNFFLGNGANGVNVSDGASDNTIGGTAGLAGNVIASSDSGVLITGEGTTGNVVVENLIGTNASDDGPLGGGENGVSVSGGASGNTIGSTTLGAGNVITDNYYGVNISGYGTTGNLVAGNLIGTNILGGDEIGNTQGVYISDEAFENIVDAGNMISGNSDGGIDISDSEATTVQANVICSNGGYGISVAGAAYTQIESNDIGTDASDGEELPNALGGVMVWNGAQDTTIGGTAAGEGNLISGNDGDGIDLAGAGTNDNDVQGNLIGTDSSGALPLGNTGNGAAISGGSSGNTLAGNTISANGKSGVLITDAGTSGNVVEGNFIGTNSGATNPLGNSVDGVHIQHTASNNTIGGTTAGAANVIANNGANGVLVGLNASDDSTGNAILRNSIYSNTDLGINLGNESSPTGTPVGGTPSGPNNLENAPVLTSALNSGSTTTITGTLSSTASTTFRVEFFSNPSGTSQGETYLGFVNVTTNSSGQGSFNFSPSSLVAVGLNVTATATDPNGNTSELSTTLTVEAAPTNITPDLSIKLGGFVFNRKTGQFTQSITITNTSGAAITGPIELVFLALRGATLVNQTGTYNGNPYITVLSSGSLGVGQSLTFSLVFADPTLQSITYTAEFLAGPIPPQQ
jgi:Right handed beta helix region